MNSRFVLALGISAGMALLVSGIFYQVAVRNRPSQSEPVELREVVVASRDLETGAAIGASDLRLDFWPANRVPDGAFGEVDLVMNRVPFNRILVNEPISERRLAPLGSGVGLSPKIPTGMRAVSVRVDDVNGVAGFVLPEARVDVLATGLPRGDGEAGHMTRTILGNVLVLSAGENLEPDSSGRPQRVPVVTLLLNPHQTELLTLASNQGKLRLVLRNTRDDEVLESRGVVERELFVVGMEKPAPRPFARPAPVVRIELPPPPPPTVEIEVIRGNQRSVQSITPVGRE
jgi:pilus assembly protein CpaB